MRHGELSMTADLHLALNLTAKVLPLAWVALVKLGQGPAL